MHGHMISWADRVPMAGGYAGCAAYFNVWKAGTMVATGARPRVAGTDGPLACSGRGPREKPVVRGLCRGGQGKRAYEATDDYNGEKAKKALGPMEQGRSGERAAASRPRLSARRAKDR